MKNKYRIVTDKYAGFEVQIKYWWLPFLWFQCGMVNTHVSIEKAKEYIAKHKCEHCFKRRIIFTEAE